MIIFITGASGVGKSSVHKTLESLLGSKGFVVHDFDERGVPDAADGSWRINETRHWIKLGRQNNEKEISTIICGGARPSDAKDLSGVLFIFLDASEDIIRKCLLSRYTTPESIKEIERASGKSLEQFVIDNEISLKDRRKEIEKYNMVVIDTTLLSTQEVAQKIVTIVLS